MAVGVMRAHRYFCDVILPAAQVAMRAEHERRLAHDPAYRAWWERIAADLIEDDEPDTSGYPFTASNPFGERD